ncbi:acyl-CoA dehydrogenase family protein [Maricaulis sp.]|uniref:acyl-CoA dehydrogenase family protein n=1 Tax=Maricaulis sp. TaxID=1486257 RepID=UPI001B0F522B|nr:acyl-CoA dehydrogenase family protein [Maricaulis sp.]MBO6766322.1 acyl-CoA dehydrogenase family protein [Maricaulis sp.]
MATAELTNPADALEAFRKDAADWLAANFPKSLVGKENVLATVEGGSDPDPEAVGWKRAMGEKGWGTPTWPKEYGGGGLSFAEARVLQEEMGKIGAWNPIGGMGVMMLGPTLLEFASEEQKQRHIPPICRGEIRWCQGYSEPGAGSDLASLQTKCEDKGDHWLVNGQKTWTSGGQWADWCFALVRTDTSKKHEGISFILLDMKSPGVEVKPIRMISGTSPFCETFFTDVKVPKENLVGDLGNGWTIGKRLLQHERTNLSGGGSLGRGQGPSLSDIAKHYVGTDAEGRIADADLRMRIVRHEMEAQAFKATARRVMLESKSGNISLGSSILKNVGARITQERAELTLEIMGMNGLGWSGDGFNPAELGATRGWLWGKAVSIYGGTTEIQNNVIAKRILGMLDHQ